MTFDALNIIAAFSLVAIFFIIGKMWRDSAVKKNKKNTADPEVINQEMTGYKKILAATHWLENERQRNTGEHYEDEVVYLNRAQTIKDKTPFFSFVNMNE